jgi:hypothetical protein
MTREIFIRAIHEKRKVRVTFFSKEDSGTLTRVCAPMDFGPSRRAHVKNNRFHLWDYESDSGMHTLSLEPEQIQCIEILNECFTPQEFVTWDTGRTTWFVPRDWGEYS